MPIPAECARISLVGHLGLTEIFDTSFWIGGVGVPTSNADANTLAAQVSAQLGGPTLTELCTLISDDSGYDQVRVYSYPTGGPTATYVGEADIGSGIGTGLSSMPDQQCIVVTLRTPEAGRSRRGRMYLPANGRGLSDNHLLDASIPPAIAGAMADFFSAVNGLGSTNDVVVVSQTLGDFLAVDRVSVDQRVDIQRRRANQQNVGITSSAAVDLG